MSIDFITKLLKSKDSVTGITYNSIMVIVDRFTKYLIVVLFKKTYTAIRTSLTGQIGQRPQSSDHDYY